MLNDADVNPPADEAFELVVAVANGQIRDVVLIAERLAVWRGAIG